MAVFYNSGQDCCAGTRLYVDEVSCLQIQTAASALLMLQILLVRNATTSSCRC